MSLIAQATQRGVRLGWLTSCSKPYSGREKSEDVANKMFGVSLSTSREPIMPRVRLDGAGRGGAGMYMAVVGWLLSVGVGWWRSF